MKHASICTVKVKELGSFVEDFLLKHPESHCVPISRKRAYSQMKNPHADPDDTGLFVAYVDTTCVGYLGVMPGLLRKGKECFKVHFSSTAYVPEEYQRTGAGIYLARALSKIQGDLIGCDNRPKAERLWRGFDKVEEFGFRTFSLPISLLERSPLALQEFLKGITHEQISNSAISALPEWYSNTEEVEFIS